MNNATSQTTPPPRATSTVHFSLFDDGDVLAVRTTHLVTIVAAGAEAFKVSLKDRVQQRAVEQNFPTFQFLRVVAGEGGLLGLRRDPNSAASSSRSYAVDEALQGVFALFPKSKSVRGLVRTRGRNWVRTLIHGLRRLVPSPWRALTTSLRRSRSRRRRWWWVQGLALQLAFGQCVSAGGSSSTSWVGQCGGVPVATGAPSHTQGLSFTRKPQPMNISSPRTFLTEAVEAASGPGEGWPGRRGGRRRCVASFRPGCRSSSHW